MQLPLASQLKSTPWQHLDNIYYPSSAEAKDSLRNSRWSIIYLFALHIPVHFFGMPNTYSNCSLCDFHHTVSLHKSVTEF